MGMETWGHLRLKDNATPVELLVQCYSDTVAHSPGLVLRKSHNDTLDTSTRTIDTDDLGDIYFEGYDATPNIAIGAKITAQQMGATDTYCPTALKFTTYSATAENTNLLTLGQQGQLFVGNNIVPPTKTILASDNYTNSLHFYGLTAERPAITFRNPDVAHGCTTYSDTDVGGGIGQLCSYGGLLVCGIVETGTAKALNFYGIATDTDSTSTGAGFSCVQFDCRKVNGTGVAGFAATDNIFGIRNSTASKFIVKGDGDVYIDGTYETFDIEDDIALLTDLNNHLGKNNVSPSLAQQEKLRNKKLIGDKPSTDEPAEMMSLKNTKALHIGATVQNYKMIKAIAKKLGITEGELKVIAQEISTEE